MELKGTIQSLRSFEQMLVTSLPHKLLHDGGQEFMAFGQGHKSKCYSKLYQLFPHGAKQLWEERVNVRFYYDERFGVGTMRISARGMALMPQEIQQLMGLIDDVYLVPKSSLSIEQARELGALNLVEARSTGNVKAVAE